MKVIKMLSLLIVVAYSMVACSKSADEAPAPSNENLQISNDEAIDIIEGALAESTQGLANETEEIAALTDASTNFADTGKADSRNNQGNEKCGIQQDTSFSFVKNEANLTANYEINVRYLMNCNQRDLPESIDYQRTASGNYESKRMTSEDETTSDWKVENVLTGAEYILSGTYNRKGKQTSKVFHQKQISSDLTMELNSLKVDKGKQTITSGQATFTMKGTDASNKSFDYSGEIIFTGSQTATIVLNGETYTIDW